MKNIYPKLRKSAGYKNCPICGKQLPARGMGSHVRQVHRLVVQYVKKEQEFTKEDNLSDFKFTKANNLSNSIPKPIQDIAEVVTGKDLSECKRPDGVKLYTEQDLWILLARICRLVLTEDSSNLISKWNTDYQCAELIADFERRFQCKFSDVKMANPDVRPAKTDAENWKIVNRYADLPYSR